MQGQRKALTQAATSPRRAVFYTAVASVCLSGSGLAEEKQLLWGDTHVHTNLSFDSYLFGNTTADPETAYRFAKGLPVLHPMTRVRVQLDRPLDFLAVADHAEALGVVKRIDARDQRILETEFFKQNEASFAAGAGSTIFRYIARALGQGAHTEQFAELQTPEILAPAWEEVITAADQHYQPGEFTTLISWEWSAAPSGSNLHRVVISDADAEAASRFLPFSAVDSQDPEKLWEFLSETAAATNVNFVSIPHNPNLSRGLAFSIEDVNGKPLTADYARRRMMWERVVEVTQTKGDSETHPILSPTDEFANFEFYPFFVAGGVQGADDAVSEGSYARSALKRGLSIQEETGENPFQFGMIGSSDVHTGLATTDESAFAGKLPRYATPEARLDRNREFGRTRVNTWDMGAQGLAAVWSEENSREAIIEAFRRREVYATTGPRITLRVFAGPSLKPGMIRKKNWVRKATARGVPMGGELTGHDGAKAPTFLIQAAKDPRGAKLDRVQVVKGWQDAGGETHEAIFNVALSDRRVVGEDGAAPLLPDTVDRETGRVDDAYGEDEFLLAWTDPAFNAEEHAFYYVRVIETPTPRHSLYDEIALQTRLPDYIDRTIQERAYSSPIWYSPGPAAPMSSRDQ